MGSKSKTGFNMKLFERGEYSKSSEAAVLRLLFRKLLYPNDVTNEGKELRIKTTILFISAAIPSMKTITVNLVTR